MPSAPPFAKLRIFGPLLRGYRALMYGAGSLALVLVLVACADDEPLANVDRIVRDEAQAAERKQDFAAAIHHYGTLYDADRDNLETIVALARNLRHGGQGENAQRLLQDATTRLGLKPALLLEKGKVEIALGHPEQAADTLHAAVQAAPSNWEAPASLAIALDRLGRYDEAAVEYHAADRLNPDNPDVFNNYALSRALAGHIDEAISILKKAVILKTAPPRVRENLAFLEALKSQPPHPGRLGVPLPAVKTALPN